MPRLEKKKEFNLLELDKVLPQAVELEEAVLGAIMLEKDALTQIIYILTKPEVFYNSSHQVIFEAIMDLFDHGNPIDILTVTEQLKFNKKLDIAGGPYYISKLTSKVASSANIVYHSRIIFQKYLQRKIIQVTSDVNKKSYEDSTDVFELYDYLQEEIKKLGIDSMNVKENIEDSVKSTFDFIETHADVNSKNYFKTRLEGVNTILAPSPGNVLMVGGMSKSGKTSFVADMIMGLHQLNPNDVSTLWYSMEDPAKHLILGYISREIKLTLKQMLGIGYKMTAEEIAIAKSYQSELLKFDIEFVSKRTKIKTIKNHFINFIDKRKELHNKEKGRMYILVIDNLMKLTDYGEERGQQNTTTIDDYVASIIGDIFDATKDCCYIIMLHHFTKEQFDKKNIVDAFRPYMGHFRGSSRLHEICTQVALINRPGFFDDLVKEYKDTPYEETIKHLFLIDVTMNRFIGTTGIIRLLCNLNYRTFSDLNVETNQQ
jgi:hypothetical protein